MGIAWEHVSVRFYSKPPKVWKTASPNQMAAVRDLQRLGFECAALTPLGDGSMYMMFKRAVAPKQEAPQIEDRPDVSVGLYL